MLIRNGEHIYAPDDTMTVTPDDQVLVVGHHWGLEALVQTQFSDASAEYIATGVQVPETWVWRRLNRSKRRSRSRQPVG